MSIETLLTLGLTAVILGVAFVVRLIVLGSLKLGLLLAGKDPSWLKPQTAPAPKAPAGPRTAARRRRPAPGSGAALGRAMTTAGRKTAAALAALGAALAAGAAALEGWADATNRRLAPRTAHASAALRSRTAAATKTVAPFFVTAIATVQHLVTTAGSWVRKRVMVTAAPPRRAAEPKRVINLDRDDPLAANRKRPAAGARL